MESEEKEEIKREEYTLDIPNYREKAKFVRQIFEEVLEFNGDGDEEDLLAGSIQGFP